MIDGGSILTFLIVSFSLALILIMKKDSLAPQFKRFLAIVALVMISMSFVLIVYSFLNMGKIS